MIREDQINACLAEYGVGEMPGPALKPKAWGLVDHGTEIIHLRSQLRSMRNTASLSQQAVVTLPPRW